MKNISKWLSISTLALASLGVCAKQTLSCDADRSSISHSLEIIENESGVPDFSYLSSTPSQGLALNCTIDSSLVNGAPKVSGNTVTYSLSGGDSLSVTKQPHGYLLDMSKLDAANYCSGIVAKKITVTAGRKRCKIQ
jgi:hypothetical protein